MNINEIAKMAGVSRATVSRYLNDGYVSEEKKEKIREIIEKTGYNPSSQAKMLRTKKTNLIGVIIPKINSESISRMVAGISEVLSKEGYQLLLANTSNDEKEELKYLNLFKSNQVDGIILMGTIFTKAHKKALEELQVPVVILGQRLPGYSCVYNDDYNAAKELTELLLENAKQIAYLGVTQKDEAAGRSREEGFLAAYREWSTEDEGSKPIMMETDFTLETAYKKAKVLFESNKKIDSIFCATDNIALGVLKYLRECGKKVPEEVQITGVGDAPIANLISPMLTTVHYYYKTSGTEAARMLLEIIKSSEYVRKEIKMGYRILPNESTRTH